MAEEKKEELENLEQVRAEKEEKEEQKENKTKQKEELNKKQEELDELTDRYKRILAEFENFKKRSEKERELLYSSILSDVIGSFLPVIDNLEKAAMANTQDENYKQGVELVLKQFEDVLNSVGVTKIEGVGERFDPELHEAVSSVEDKNMESNTIKEEYRKGYKIGQKVIRHSMVVVVS